MWVCVVVHATSLEVGSTPQEGGGGFVQDKGQEKYSNLQARGAISARQSKVEAGIELVIADG